MCGRYELKSKARELNRYFPLLHLAQSAMPDHRERCPTDPLLMITAGHSGFHAGIASWGLVGAFLDQPPRTPLLNLRSEGLASKPFYSKILKRSRCLIPATAFFEWQTVAGGKQKMRISQPDGELLMLAGIFDHHPDAGTTCAILTTAADQTISRIHERMPLIMGREQGSFWLEEHDEFSDHEFAEMLHPSGENSLLIEAVNEEEPSPQLALIFA